MSKKLIDSNESLTEVYDRLLRRQRILTLNLIEYKTVVCLNCDRPLKDHLSDRRCNTYMTSSLFRCNEEEELRQVQRALHLVEELENLKVP